MRELGPDLQRLEADGLLRRRRLLSGPQGASVTVDGRECLNFCSNDYLGLANHPQVVAALQAAAARDGVGSGSAHLVCGHGREHHALEEALAEFTGRPRALLFSTGYMANLAVISALAGRGDTVLEDRLNHASLLDGARLAGARLLRYAHADLAALEQRLHAGRAELVVSDGVFSMDGDIAPLPGLAALARRHDARLVIDDAHGLGVLGTRGGGCCEHHGLGIDAVPVLVGTLGKAFGTAGAFVAADAPTIETLIQRARPYIYTTAMPPALAAATRASLQIVRDEPQRREHLRGLIGLWQAGARQLGLPLQASPTPIQPLLLGSAERALAWQQGLLERGVLVSAIRPPTVPAGTARLRVTLSAAHSAAQVERLLQALAEVQAAHRLECSA